MKNEQTVRELYAAFQRQDVPAILALVADDVDWRNDRLASRECPWNGDFSGKAGVPEFFQAIAEHVELPVFDIKAVIASGAHVAVILRIEGKVRKNGRTWANDAVHLWGFDGHGRIASYRHFNDTAAELAAWRG